jgi:heptosyltransferase III
LPLANPDSPRAHTRLRLLRLVAHALSKRVERPRAVPQRVLLLRPDHIGDVLLSAPAVALLRANLPNTHLTYLVGPWGAEAARHGPNVDAIRTLSFPGFTRRHNPNLLQPYALLVREAARIHRERYDMAVVLRPDHWWGALLALAAGVPLRVGTNTPETRPLLTHCTAIRVNEHAARHTLAVAHLALSVVGAPADPPLDPDRASAFTLPAAAQRAAAELWAHFGLHPLANVIALHPNAGAPLKSWPVASWARLADALARQGHAVLLAGAPSDRRLLKAIADRTTRRPHVAAGQSLDVSAALYERCALLVTVDSGAGHLAAAVGTPTVRLYGPAPPTVFGPWPAASDQHVLMTEQLACAPCGYLEAPPCGAKAVPACMLALSVDAVVKAVGDNLAHG